MKIKRNVLQTMMSNKKNLNLGFNFLKPCMRLLFCCCRSTDGSVRSSMAAWWRTGEKRMRLPFLSAAGWTDGQRENWTRVWFLTGRFFVCFALCRYRIWTEAHWKRWSDRQGCRWVDKQLLKDAGRIDENAGRMDLQGTSACKMEIDGKGWLCRCG